MNFRIRQIQTWIWIPVLPLAIPCHYSAPYPWLSSLGKTRHHCKLWPPWLPWPHSLPLSFTLFQPHASTSGLCTCSFLCLDDSSPRHRHPSSLCLNVSCPVMSNLSVPQLPFLQKHKYTCTAYCPIMSHNVKYWSLQAWWDISQVTAPKVTKEQHSRVCATPFLLPSVILLVSVSICHSCFQFWKAGQRWVRLLRNCSF